MPASSHALPFARTYTVLAGSSPTRTTARPGRTPRSTSSAVLSAASRRIERAIATPSMSSAGKIHRACLADQDHLDLSGILKLRLDAARNFFAQRGHPRIVDVVRSDYHAHLPSRLNREHLLDTAVARCNPLESLEPLHVRLERLTPCARTRARDRIRSLHEHRDLAFVRHVVVVRGNAVDHERMFAVAGCHLHAELHVSSLVLVRQHLAHVVEKRTASRHRDVEAELGSHDAGEPCHFLRVVEDVLTVARAPPHAADELDDLLMESVYSAGVCRALTSVDDSDVDFLTRFRNDFLDATRMDAAVGHELLQ